MSEYAVVANIPEILKEKIAREIGRYDARINLEYINSSTEAWNFIEDKIDPEGHKLILAVEAIPAINKGQSASMIERTVKSHPLTKKLLLYDSNSENRVSNKNLTNYVEGGRDEISFIQKIGETIQEYLSKPKVEFSSNGTVFKMAETLYEKREFFKTRFKIYTCHENGVSLKNVENIPKRYAELYMEVDSFDSQDLTRMTHSRDIRYIVAMNKGQCVGGARIIEGRCPLEDGICVSDGREYLENPNFSIGKRFTLDNYRKENIITREVSRLIVDSSRESRQHVIQVLQMVDLLTCDEDTLFCTSQANPEKIKFYKNLGFEIIGPKINYSLDGEWVPMIRHRNKANKNLNMSKEYPENDPDRIEGISKTIHERIITHPIDTYTNNRQSLLTKNEPVYIWRIK